jgi:hypothetical protein
MQRKVFQKSNPVRRLPTIEKQDNSCIVASPVGSPTFRIRRYLTKNIDEHAAARNYLSPIKNTKSSGKKKVNKSLYPTRNEQEGAVISSGNLVNDMAAEGSTFSISTLQSMPEASDPQDSLTAPESILLHKGNKLFWRINRTIDFMIYL